MSTAETEPSSQARADQRIDNDANPLVGSAPQPAEKIVAENQLAFLIWDGFPVTEGHLLAIPRRHVADYFELHQPERNAIQRLLDEGRKLLRAKHPEVSGFNVGINCGEAAGQTIFHCHVHLIPRRAGDVANARGGVRGVIAGKQDYTSDG